MNERIMELAKQADIIQWDMLPSGARTPDHESVVRAKKFAELILSEVISTIYRSDISDRKQEKLVKELAYKFGLK